MKPIKVYRKYLEKQEDKKLKTLQEKREFVEALAEKAKKIDAEKERIKTAQTAINKANPSFLEKITGSLSKMVGPSPSTPVKPKTDQERIKALEEGVIGR